MPSPASRRSFLTTSAAWTAALWAAPRLRGDDRPTVTDPRATSGDVAVEPKWEQGLTMTVGPKDADLVGTSHKVLQAAVDYVAGLGGGTVHVLPGEYHLRGSVRLRSGVRLLGSGSDSILTKNASQTVKLATDSDWYDQEITLVDAKGFEVGDSVCLKTKNPHTGGMNILKRTLVARSGNRFKLDKALRENFWQLGESTCSSLFPLVTGDEIERIAVENITLDGNRANNELLDGNYAGCVFLQDCRNVAFRKVTARNYHGDGLSWQICHDVVVEDCHSHDHSGLGLHPGSGSQRPVIRRNKLERNDIGIFFCWGVKYGRAEENQCTGNRVGISIGHRDTDNLIRRNTIAGSTAVGILFRPERGPGFCGHRNRLEENVVADSGKDDGIAIDIQGGTESITLQQNQLKETRGPARRIGIRLGSQTRDIRLEENRISGFSQDVQQLS